MTTHVTTEHLVEVSQRTGGAHLDCAGCDWNADIRTYAGYPQPLTVDQYRQVAFEARALADAHRYSWDGRP